MTRLFAIAALVLATPALARHASSASLSCPERCEKSTKDCVEVCSQYAGSKGGGMCKKACAEGEKKCEDKCKKKGQ